MDDILVHPRDNDLIVATHGRSVWIADDITALQQLTPEVREQDAVLFDIRPAVAWLQPIARRGSRSPGRRCSSARTRRAARAISYYLKNGGGDVKIAIADANGRTIRTSDRPRQGRDQPCDVERSRRIRRKDKGRGRAAVAVADAAVAAERSSPGTYLVTLDGRREDPDEADDGAPGPLARREVSETTPISSRAPFAAS